MGDEAIDKGYDAMMARDYVEAIRIYTNGINLDRTNHILYHNRSAAYLNLNLHHLALKDARKAVDLEPDRSKGYQQLGVAYHALAREKDAIWAFKKGLEFDPDSEDLKYGLARSERALTRSRTQQPDKRGVSTKPKNVKMKCKGRELGRERLIKDLISEQNAIQERFLRLLEADVDFNVDRVRNDNKFSVSAAMNVVNRMVNDGLMENGSDFWCFALDQLEDAKKRELFMSLSDDVSRLAWLNHKHDLGK